MNKKLFARYALPVVALVFAAAAFAFWQMSGAPKTIDGRWYGAKQVAHGEEIFNANCMSCHGARGRGAADWQTPLANGAYPPPPLDGSAHTWHHPLAQLRRTLKEGNIRLGGQMPPFGDKLTAEERDAVIAYFQSLWPERVYQTWDKRVNRQRN